MITNYIVSLNLVIIAISLSIVAYNISKVIIEEGPWTSNTWSKYRFKWLTWLYLKCLCWRKKGKLVVLCSTDSSVYISVAWQRDPQEDYLLAYVYSTSNINLNKLHKDGTTSKDEGGRSYIRNWLPLDEQERIWMILTGATPFDPIVTR